MATAQSSSFDSVFREQFELLLRLRRDVRHFRTDAVDPDLIQHLLRSAMLAPSVGFSQPWRWVMVNDPQLRSVIGANHDSAKNESSKVYEADRLAEYGNLKLAGITEAPVQIAVFADCATEIGHGLGRQTMPGTLLWSVVMAIYALWLGATARGLGVGWVSILDPTSIAATLRVPREWTFVAYLCIGWPAEYLEKPLLETAGWESRTPFEDVVVLR